MILDPVRVCKRNKQQQHDDHLHDICRNDTRLFDVIMKGINLGLDECQFQFRHNRWNCTTQRKSLKKILAKGECECARRILTSDEDRMESAGQWLRGQAEDIKVH